MSEFVGNTSLPRGGSKTPELAANRRRGRASDIYSRVSVLRTESKDELARILADISEDIRPKNSIEKLNVREVAEYTWNIMRLNRIMNGILNNALRRALARFLDDILLPPSHWIVRPWLPPQNLAYDWLFDPEIKRRVSSVLEEIGVDESAIEAEAYRLVADDLAKADRMLNSAVVRRDRALDSIAKYRKTFGDQLRRSSDRVLAADEAAGIVDDVED